MSCKHADTEQNEPNMQNVTNNSHMNKKKQSEEVSTSPERLVQQQHMLFLVLHGQFCRCPPHKCQVTPLCGKIKSLWAHAKNCNKGSKCTNSYCAAARSVFNHFKTCSDRRQCKLCGPVLNATIKHNTIQQNLDSSFVSQTLRKCHFNMKRERLEKMEEVTAPNYKFKRICCAWLQVFVVELFIWDFWKKYIFLILLCIYRMHVLMRYNLCTSVSFAPKFEYTICNTWFGSITNLITHNVHFVNMIGVRVFEYSNRSSSIPSWIYALYRQYQNVALKKNLRVLWTLSIVDTVAVLRFNRWIMSECTCYSNI